MKTLFISSGDITWASARLRCHWPAAYMGADVVRFDHADDIYVDEYDAFIYQKVYNLDDARKLKEAGKKVYWDLCDPVHWFQPEQARALLPYLDGVVFSSKALQEDFQEWCERGVPCYTIPDRLELSAYPTGHQHQESDPVRMIWYGIAANRIALFGAFTNLSRLWANGYKFELTIFDERPDQQFASAEFPIYYTRWSLPLESEVISSHDLALLPPYPGPWGAVKSNNKHLTAWACGLPVTSGLEYGKLARLVESWEFRKQWADTGWDTLTTHYNVEQSAKEWEAILCK